MSMYASHDDPWRKALGELERSTAMLCAQGFLPGAPVAEMLAQRQAAIHKLAALDPAGCPEEAVERLRSALLEGEMAIARLEASRHDIRTSLLRAVHLESAIARLAPQTSSPHCIDCQG